MAESGGGGGGAAAAAALNENNIQEESYGFNKDPAIKNFTWGELLAYNIAFLKGEKKSSFYHAAPLLSDQVPSDLIQLHELGVFTIGGQGTQISEGYNKKTGLFWKEQQRAYLDGFIPRPLAQKLISEAKKDPEVVLEVSEILSGQQLYLSSELVRAWARPPHYFSLTRAKAAKKKEDVDADSWEDETTNPGPMGFVPDLENVHFKNWYKWVCDGLCYFSFIDKEYGQEPKSLPARMVKYLTESAGGKRRKSKSTRRTKKRGKKTRRV